jgi:hypothetical protein
VPTVGRDDRRNGKSEPHIEADQLQPRKSHHTSHALKKETAAGRGIQDEKKANQGGAPNSTP